MDFDEQVLSVQHQTFTLAHLLNHQKIPYRHAICCRTWDADGGAVMFIVVVWG
jgi:hypothetical protein